MKLTVYLVAVSFLALASCVFGDEVTVPSNDSYPPFAAGVVNPGNVGVNESDYTVLDPGESFEATNWDPSSNVYFGVAAKDLAMGPYYLFYESAPERVSMRYEMRSDCANYGGITWSPQIMTATQSMHGGKAYTGLLVHKRVPITEASIACGGAKGPLERIQVWYSRSSVTDFSGNTTTFDNPDEYYIDLRF